MSIDNRIGVTERADPTVNTKWIPWVNQGKPAILITKMPRLLFPMVSKYTNILVHCTITGMGSTKVEPNIDQKEVSLEYYHKLCSYLGKERVVLRIDPIPDEPNALDISKEIAKESESRIRISFMDAYPHVRERFSKAGIYFYQTSFHQPISYRYKIWKELGKPEVCAEPGIPSIPCVSTKDCEILGVEPNTERKGQRSLCGCLSNKFELCTWPPKCTYGCLYCYWKD